MTEFKVISIVDGDTFDVSPSWSWNGNSGTRVRPAGFNAPELHTYGGQAAKERLERLILGKNVQLGSAYRIDRGRLVCDVFLKGKNIADHFPEYQ